MMISPWTIYWITRLDAIRNVCIAVTLLAVVAVSVAVIAYFASECDPAIAKRCRRVWWTYGCILAVSATGLVMGPTSREAAAIIAIPAIVNNENVQQETGEIYKLAKDWLAKQAKQKDEP